MEISPSTTKGLGLGALLTISYDGHRWTTTPPIYRSISHENLHLQYIYSARWIAFDSRRVPGPGTCRDAHPACSSSSACSFQSRRTCKWVCGRHQPRSFLIVDELVLRKIYLFIYRKPWSSHELWGEIGGSNNPHQHLWPSWKDNRMQHQPATQGNANSQCTTSASTTQGGQRTSSQRQCTSSASAQCSTGSTTSASARYHPMRPSDVPHIALMFCLSCFFGWLGRQQTLLSFCGVNQHCYLSCGYHFEIASSSVWLRAEILEDCEMAEYVVTAFFELGNLDGGRVRQVKVLSFSCNFYTDTKKHWVSSLIYILVWFPLFHFFSLAIDCLRSRLLFKKDKAIDNWLMRAVRPLPA